MNLTASKLELASRCAYAFRPDVHIPREPSSEAASRGTQIHNEIDEICNGGLVDKPSSETLAALSWLALNTFDQETEQAFSYGADGVQAHGRVTGRAYPTRPGAIFGTADVVASTGNHAIVADWKTGIGRVSPARDNLQLGFLAMCLSRVRRCPTVKVAIVKLNGSEVREDIAELDDFDFDAIEGTLDRIVRELPTAEPRPGWYCSVLYCPAQRGACPAMYQAQKQIVPVSTPIGEITTAAEAATMIAQFKAAQAWSKKQLDSIEDALKSWVKSNGPVDMGDGRIWRDWQEERSTIRLDSQPALDAVVSAGACEALTVSKTGLVEAIGKKEAGDLLKLLDTFGAVQRSTVTKWDSRKGKV